MPDAIATQAHLFLVVGLFGAAALVPVVSWLWRRALGLADGADAGLAVGVGAWSVGMVVATSGIGEWVLQMRNGVEVEGRLIGFTTQVTTLPERGAGARGMNSGRKIKSAAPQVEFVAADGRRHVATLLGGSLSNLEPGASVKLRHDPADPASATAVDFLNELGALGLFGLLTALGLMSTVYFGWSAAHGLRQARAAAPVRKGAAPRAPLPPTRLAAWRDGPGQRWRAPLMRTGVASLVLAVVAPFVMALPDEANIVRVFATALAGVAVALASFGLRAALERGCASGLVLYGRFIGVAGFGLFAAWLWLLGAA